MLSARSAPDLLVAAALRHKRHAVIYGETLDAVDVRAVPKSAATRELLLAALKGSVFFGDFGFDELTALVDGMEPRAVAAGTTVIRQGDAGDYFYVIERGSVRPQSLPREGHAPEATARGRCLTPYLFDALPSFPYACAV